MKKGRHVQLRAVCLQWFAKALESALVGKGEFHGYRAGWVSAEVAELPSRQGIAWEGWYFANRRPMKIPIAEIGLITELRGSK